VCHVKSLVVLTTRRVYPQPYYFAALNSLQGKSKQIHIAGMYPAQGQFEVEFLRRQRVVCRRLRRIHFHLPE
jgi:hypothetical protein